MEMRIPHPKYHDEGRPLDYVLTQADGCGLYNVKFEGAALCENVILEQAIEAMLVDAAGGFERNTSDE